MGGFESFAKILAKPPKRNKDDDGIDRLSSQYTVVLLLVFVAVVSMTNYIGKPINCWAPKHFTGNHIKYTNSYCWVRNTYYLPWDNEIPRAHEDDKRQMLPYYQWIPFILLTQAIFFYLPSCFWHCFNDKAGIDSDDILKNAYSYSRSESIESKEKKLDIIVNQIHIFLHSRRRQAQPTTLSKRIVQAILCGPCSKRNGNYLVPLYILSKILYCVNVFGQMFMLNKVLGARFSTFGADILTYLIKSEDWTEAAFVAFPRVTLCDFNIRRLGNVHRYTLQCVLPINLYNEKIYVFLWFWFLLVGVISVAGLIQWLMRCLMRSDRKKFVINHLYHDGKLRDNRNQDKVDTFLDNYLRQDGAFIMRLIVHNTNAITTSDIMTRLWNKWRATCEDGNMEGETSKMNPDQLDGFAMKDLTN